MNPAHLRFQTQLKQSARRIRTYKNVRDSLQRARHSAASVQTMLHNLRREHRHRHIAYCELRGVPRERIERPRPENLPSEAWIARIKEEVLATTA